MNKKCLLLAMLSGLMVSGVAQASSNSQMAIGGMFVSAFDSNYYYAEANAPYQVDPTNPVIAKADYNGKEDYQGKYISKNLTPFNYGANNMWSALVLSGVTSTLLAPWELDFNAAIYFNPFTNQGVMGSGDIAIRNYQWGTFKLGYRGNEAAGNVQASVAYTGAKFTAVESGLTGGDWSWNFPGFSWLSPRWKGFRLALSAGLDHKKVYSNESKTWTDFFADTYSSDSFPTQYGSVYGAGLKWGNRRDDINFAFSYTQFNPVNDPTGFFPPTKVKRLYGLSAFYALESGYEDQVGLSFEAAYANDYGMKNSFTEQALKDLNYQSNLEGVRVGKSDKSKDPMLLAPALNYHHFGADLGLAWTHGRNLFSFVAGWDTFRVKKYPGFHIPAWETKLIESLGIQKGTLKDTNFGVVIVPNKVLSDQLFQQYNEILKTFPPGMGPDSDCGGVKCSTFLPHPWPSEYSGLQEQTEQMKRSYGTLRTSSIYLGMQWVYFWSSSLHFTFKVNGAYTKLKMHYDYGNTDRDLGHAYTATAQAGFRVLF